MIAAHDKELLDGLEKAGLAVSRGDDGNSLLEHQLIKAGKFYIDQGACQMIIDGRIKILRSEDGVREFVPEGIVLANGIRHDSDLIVLATGFERSNVTLEHMMGKEVIDKGGKGTIGLLDDGQERIGVSLPNLVNFPFRKHLTNLFAVLEGHGRTRILVHDRKLPLVEADVPHTGSADWRN